MNERKLIDEIKKLVEEQNIINGFFNGSIFIDSNGNKYNNLILTSYDPGTAFIVKYQDKWLCVVSSSNGIIRENIIVNRRNKYIENNEQYKVKILFYIETIVDEAEVIQFYVGGDISSPKLIYSVNKSNINLSTIIGFVHNYSTSYDFTIQYDLISTPSIYSRESVIIQGSEVIDDEITDGTEDRKYYMFHHIYKGDNAAYTMRYKGNKIWKSEEILIDINTFPTEILYPPTELVNYDYTIYSGISNYEFSYNNYNVILNNNTFSIYEGFIEENTVDSGSIASQTNRTTTSYLIDDVQTLTTNCRVENDIKIINSTGYKLLNTWKDAYIVQLFNFDYEEYYYTHPNQSSPKSTNCSIEYILKIGEEEISINNNNLGGKVTANTEVEINENTTNITFNLSYFTVDRNIIDFIDTNQFNNVSVLFAKKENNFTWLCEGTINSITVDGNVYLDQTLFLNGIVISELNSCVVDVSINSVSKVPHVSFASTNGSLLINNGSINSLFNSLAIYSRFTPENSNVINDINSLAVDCFYIDYSSIGETNITLQPYFFSFGYANTDDQEYIQERNYDVLNNLLAHSTYKNKTIYMANTLDNVKTKNTFAYIESWKIDDMGNVNRQNKIIKEKVYSLKNSNANIISVSYYP